MKDPNTPRPLSVDDPALLSTMDLGARDPGGTAVLEDPEAVARNAEEHAHTLEAEADKVASGSRSREATAPAGDRRYTFVREIGRGGMGRVLLVHDERLNRDVALKVMSGAEHDPDTGRGPDSARTRRFLREVQLSGRLEHPSIVPVHDLGAQPDGAFFYTMRYMEGKSLKEALAGCSSLSARLHFLPNFRDVCNAMAFAHSRGVIHRDLKPANVVLGDYGETMIVDWGLAKSLEEGSEADQRLAREISLINNSGSGSDQATAFGAVLGTPAYMAPEQAMGFVDEVDERSDIYSLGAMLYELVTGAPPFVGGSPHRTLLLTVRGDVVPVRDKVPEAPAELAAIAEKALRRDKADRYATCAQMAADVTAYLSGEKVSSYAYSNWQLVRRFARRNQVAVGAALVVLSAILATAVLMTGAYRRESRARREATNAFGQEARARRVADDERAAAQDALRAKIEEERRANFHIAQSHLYRADQLLREAYWLDAMVYAAASLVHNPGNPRGPLHHPAFCAGSSACDELSARALGIYFKARHLLKYRFERVLLDDPSLRSELGAFRNRLHVSPDGRHLVTDFVGRAPVVYELATGRSVLELAALSGFSGKTAFDASGGLVTVERDGRVRGWAVPSGSARFSVASSLRAPQFLERVPRSDALVAVSGDGSLHRIDAGTGAVAPLRGLEGVKARNLEISPTGEVMALMTEDYALLRHDLARDVRTDGALSGRGDLRSDFGSFSADGASFFVKTRDSNLATVRTTDWRAIERRKYSIARHETFFFFLAHAPWPADSLLASTGSSVAAILRRPGVPVSTSLDWTRLQNLTFLGYTASFAELAVAGADILALTHEGKVLHLAATRENDRRVMATLDSPVYLVERLDDGQTLLGDQDGRLTMLGPKDGAARDFGALDCPAWGADLSPDGETLAVTCIGNRVFLLDADTGARRRVFEFEERITDARYSSVGDALHVSGTRHVHSYEPRTLALLGRRPSGRGGGNGPPVQMSRDYVVWEKGRKEIVRLDLRTGELATFRLDLPGFMPFDVRLLDDRTLIVQNHDLCLHLYELPDTRTRVRFCGLKMDASSKHVWRARRLFLAGGDDGTVRLWSLDDGRPLLTIPTEVGQVATFDEARGELVMSDGQRALRLPVDLSLLGTDAVDLLRRAEALAGMCLDGMDLKPLHTCTAGQ